MVSEDVGMLTGVTERKGDGMSVMVVRRAQDITAGREGVEI